MYTAVVVFIFIVCILLALVVLIQNSKGGGLASGFTGSQQIMGVRKTTDFLEKFTWGLAISLFCLALIGNFVLPKGQTRAVQESSIKDQYENASVPAANTPIMPSGGAQKPAQQPVQQPQPVKK